MKTLYTLAALLILIFFSFISRAQTPFWTEGFGTGCNQGTMANGHVTSNGKWTVVSTGVNETYANAWYISGKADGTGRGNCDDNTCAENKQTLHISSNNGVEPNDDHCDYDDGALCSGFSICTATNARAQSPVISTVGYSGITLSFNYISYGQAGTDYASLYYSSDSGVTWNVLVNPLPQTPCCGGPCSGNATGYKNPGQWTNYSVSLPASCNNNSKVMIGFNWTNQDDGNGYDPSIGIDSIQLICIPTSKPTANIGVMDSTGCATFCTSFTDLSSGGPTSWLWTFQGATPSSSTERNPQNICYPTTGSYNVSLVVSNSLGTDSVTFINYITVYPAPNLPVITTSTGGTTFCANSPLELTSSIASGYLWNTGETTQSITITSAGSYAVTATNANKCQATDSITVTGLLPADSVPICMVTVDSLSQNNIIIWSKVHPSPLDSFIVYREITTDNYQPVGAVPDIGALSEFTDTVRTKYFPSTGNPNSGAYRYKLQILDTCGNYSSLSPYHNTLYITNNNNGTFSWGQLYTIEGDTNPVTSYDLMRDDNSNGNWHVVNSVAGTQYAISDPDYDSFKNTASWRVQTVWGITCTPTLRVSSSSIFNVSLSNVTTATILGINGDANSVNISIFPNPATNQLTIHSSAFHNKSVIVSIMNVLGETLQQEKLTWDSDVSININNLAAGMYFLQMKTEGGSFVRRFVKE